MNGTSTLPCRRKMQNGLMIKKSTGINHNTFTGYIMTIVIKTKW